MYEPILVRNRMNATAVIRSFQTNRSLIVTWKRTTNKLPNALSPVILVEKPFTTAPLSTLIYTLLINNPPLPLTGNALLKKLQILRPRKDLRDRTKQVRVPLQNQLPQQVLKTPLLPGNLIRFSFQPTLFQLATKNVVQTYRQHWPQIRTRFSRQNRLDDWYNFLLSTINPASLREQLNRVFCWSGYSFQNQLFLWFYPP